MPCRRDGNAMVCTRILGAPDGSELEAFACAEEAKNSLALKLATNLPNLLRQAAHLIPPHGDRGACAYSLCAVADNYQELLDRVAAGDRDAAVSEFLALYIGAAPQPATMAQFPAHSPEKAGQGAFPGDRSPGEKTAPQRHAQTVVMPPAERAHAVGCAIQAADSEQECERILAAAIAAAEESVRGRGQGAPSAGTIINDWLTEHGYDGLAGDGCGCWVGDLAPCEGCMGDCVPGHASVVTEADEDCDYEVGERVIRPGRRP